MDVATHNAAVVSSGDRASTKLVPAHLEVFSQVFGCIHGNGHVKRSGSAAGGCQHPQNTQCQAQIIAHATHDCDDRWWVVIADQFIYHNHRFSGERSSRAQEVMAEYCVKSESMGQELTQCAPVAQGKRKKRGSSVQPESLITIDLTDDQDTSESDSVSHLERQIEEISDVEPSIRHEDDSGNHDASRLESTTGSDSSLSEAESSHEVDDTHVDGVAAEIDDDEGKAAGPSECTLNEELSRLEQQNHLIQKPPLGQTEFSDWGELYHFLEAYMRSTFQNFVVFAKMDGNERNTNVKKNKVQDADKLIPERFAFYRKTWRCVLSSNAIYCPAQISACVKRAQSTGEWKVVISAQDTHHNHEVSKRMFYSNPHNRRIKDPLLHAEVLKLHFQRVQNKEIAKIMSKQLEFEPTTLKVWNLIDRLKRQGWTKANYVQKAEEAATNNKSSGACEDAAHVSGTRKRRKTTGLDKESKHPDVSECQKRRSARILQRETTSDPGAT